MESASSTFKIAHLGILTDLSLLDKRFGSTLVDILMKPFMPKEPYFKWLVEHIRNLQKVEGFDEYFHKTNKERSLSLGQLQIKEEPAGKVRVFAMVDL